MFRMMKVGTRLTLGFLTVVVLGIIVTSIAIYNMAQMNERAKRLYHQELMGLSYVKEANIDLIYIGRGGRSAKKEAKNEKHTQNQTPHPDPHPPTQPTPQHN